MPKALYCSDSGAACSEVIRGETEEDVLKKAAIHAAEVHGLKDIPPEMNQKMISLMRDE